MREIMKVDSIPKAMSFLTAIGSLVLLIYGTYGESYWLGFGLVLFMTSFLLIISLSGPESVAQSLPRRRSLSSVRIRPFVLKNTVPRKGVASHDVKEVSGR